MALSTPHGQYLSHARKSGDADAELTCQIWNCEPEYLWPDNSDMCPVERASEDERVVEGSRYNLDVVAKIKEIIGHDEWNHWLQIGILFTVQQHYMHLFNLIRDSRSPNSDRSKLGQLPERLI